MAQMTGGQAVVQALQREGVECVFGLPGVQIMGIYDAFYGQSDVKLITVRHEQTTTYMADGYARVTGKPGVGLVVPGPGIQNASAALGTAYSCSSPVLLVAGQIESYMLGQDKGALHEINDQLDIVRPVTKWCGRVLKVEDIPGAIHEAMRQMQTGRPRPTLVEVPPDVLATVADVTLPTPEQYAALSPDQAGHPACRRVARHGQKAADLGRWGCHCGGCVGGVTSARGSPRGSSGHHAGGQGGDPRRSCAGARRGLLWAWRAFLCRAARRRHPGRRHAPHGADARTHCPQSPAAADSSRHRCLGDRQELSSRHCPGRACEAGIADAP